MAPGTIVVLHRILFPGLTMIETLLLAVARISTVFQSRPLSNATAFFFAQEQRLFLITSRHVVFDEASGHFPDRLDIELHVDPVNVAAVEQRSIPLYANGRSLWRETTDADGTLDIAALELDRASLPATLHFQAFTPAHLVGQLNDIEVGAGVLIAGFPLGFHDELHRLPVVRQAVIASAFGLRFQGHAYFLTDARLHRGMSGAPVVARMRNEQSGRHDLPWYLLGIHSARMDVANRDTSQDERLNLNCAWYADALLKLTAD